MVNISYHDNVTNLRQINFIVAYKSREFSDYDYFGRLPSKCIHWIREIGFHI